MFFMNVNSYFELGISTMGHCIHEYAPKSASEINNT